MGVSTGNQERNQERKQMARTKPWELSDDVWERARPPLPERKPHPLGGRPPRDDRQMLGAMLDRGHKVEELLAMALGVFTSTGVVHSTLTDVGSVADLLGLLLEDLEALAIEKGGMAQLLFDKRCKVYKARSPRGLFTMPRAPAA
jgi:hypothetical protein